MGPNPFSKQGLNQPLMREVLDKLDESEGRPSELLIDSATDESEANSPIKMTTAGRWRGGVPVKDQERNDAIEKGD